MRMMMPKDSLELVLPHHFLINNIYMNQDGGMLPTLKLSDHSFESDMDEKDQTSQIVEHDPSGRFCKYNEEIGKGAYKSVYRGYDKESGCEVAWNVFLLQNVPDDERKRARQEISILKSLQHQNIINFIHSWQNKREIVFITEIVNGGSLKNYMRRITRPKLKVLKHWCRQILQGLEYLHSKHVIHRDLKLENILIDTNNNELKIGDLGLSIQLQSSYAHSVLGTPEFMAPEIYQDKYYTTKVDIYAFGMCLLEMVTGHKPFCECKRQEQVVKKVYEGHKPQSIEAIQHEKIRNIILECLKPAHERPTAKQLLSQYFNASSSDDENQAVALNENTLLQLTGESKNSSFLSYNISRQMIQTNSSTKNLNQITTNLVSLESELRRNADQKVHPNKHLTIETEEATSLDAQFSLAYKSYIITQNDETIHDLEQRQQRELQLLKQLHLNQKAELNRRMDSKQIQQMIVPQVGSGLISPNSLEIDLSTIEPTHNPLAQPIIESPSSEEECQRKSSMQCCSHEECSKEKKKKPNVIRRVNSNVRMHRGSKDSTIQNGSSSSIGI